MLLQIKGHFGDLPQIGKFVQIKGSNSAATCVTRAPKIPYDQFKPGKTLAGMVIVTMPRSGPLTPPPLSTTTLPASPKLSPPSWGVSTTPSNPRPLNTPPPAPPTRPSSQSRYQTSAGDRSASIGRAPGWQITRVEGCHLTTADPNGEFSEIAEMCQQIHLAPETTFPPAIAAAQCSHRPP